MGGRGWRKEREEEMKEKGEGKREEEGGGAATTVAAKGWRPPLHSVNHLRPAERQISMD